MSTAKEKAQFVCTPETPCETHQPKAQHTPGRLTVSKRPREIVDANGMFVADCSTVMQHGRDRGNARRLVACWNALEGIPTEQLEAGVVGDMADALQAIFQHCALIHAQWGEGCNREEADAAIAKGKDALRKAGRLG